MLKAQAGARLGQAVRRGRKTERRRGSRNRGEGKGERWKAARGDKNDRQEFPRIFVQASKAGLQTTRGRRPRDTHPSQHRRRSSPLLGPSSKLEKHSLDSTSGRREIRSPDRPTPRHARNCAQRAVVFLWASPASSSSGNPFRRQDCPCQKDATLSLLQTATHFLQPPPPTELPTAPALYVSPWTSLLSPERPALAMSRLHRIRCTSCETCTTAAAFNSGSEFRLFAAVGAGDIFLLPSAAAARLCQTHCTACAACTTGIAFNGGVNPAYLCPSARTPDVARVPQSVEKTAFRHSFPLRPQLLA